MKNILLVYPKFPENTYWSYSYAMPFIGKKASMPPLGLITVAAMIPETYNLRLVDLNIEPLQEKDLEWADMLFLSSMIIQKKYQNEVVAKAKERGVKIVAGGPLPTQYYDELKDIDHFIIGEAESGVLERFFDDLENGDAKKAYARHIIRQTSTGRAIDTREHEDLKAYFQEDCDISVAENRPDMSISPVPRFDLLKIQEYSCMSIQFSRGCPYDCEFCNEATLFGHTPRLKSAEKLIAELQALYDLNYRGSIFIVDDNFIGNIRKVKDVLHTLKEFQQQHRYPFDLFTEASINLSKDPELMGLMRDAGFDMVFVGIETPDSAVLKSMNKIHNTDMDLLAAVKTIQGYGMEVTGGFIVGNDEDPDDICDRIFHFCQKAGIPGVMVGLLTPVKGSRLHERLESEGRLLKNSAGNNTHSFELDFVPVQGKDAETISNNYKNLLSRIYDITGKNYFKRCQVLLNNLGYHPKPARDVGKHELRAFTRSLLIQPFTLYGYQYLNFLFYSLTRKLHLFPEAIRLAIMGHHYRKITRDALNADKLNSYFLKKLEYFRKKLGSPSGKEKRQGEISPRMIKEKERFLQKGRKKMDKLHPEHRSSLLETYRAVAGRIEKLFS